MEKTRVLLVDDEKDFIDVLKERLELSDYEVSACYDINQALAEIQNNDYDVAVIDLILQDTDGITAMHRIKMIKPLTECIVLSGQGTLRMAVEAMKQGAFEFLEKPCDQKMVAQVIDGACDRKREHEHRILNAAKKVYSKFEKAMVGATFAESGDIDSATKIVNEK